VGCGVQFQPLQHLELRFPICRRSLLIRRLVCRTSDEQISPECLKLDCIGAAGLGRVDQPQGQIKRSVVVHPRLGNDEYVRIRFLFYTTSRATDINTRFRQIVHNGRSRSDHAASRDLDSFNDSCPGTDHREPPDRDVSGNRSSRSDMYPILQQDIMFNGAVRIHDPTAADGRPTVNDRPVHHHGALATRYFLVDDCVRRDDQGKGQGERMQSRPEFVPRLPQTNLAHGKHGIKFFGPTAFTANARSDPR